MYTYSQSDIGLYIHQCTLMHNRYNVHDIVIQPVITELSGFQYWHNLLACTGIYMYVYTIQPTTQKFRFDLGTVPAYIDCSEQWFVYWKSTCNTF